VTSRSKARVCFCSTPGIVGSNPAACIVSVFCLVEVCASGWSPIQRSPTDCGVSEYDHKSATTGRPWSTGEGEVAP
jgi:hypothetical protein